MTLFTGLDQLSKISRGTRAFACFVNMVMVGYQSYILSKIHPEHFLEGLGLVKEQTEVQLSVDLLWNLVCTSMIFKQKNTLVNVLKGVTI